MSDKFLSVCDGVYKCACPGKPIVFVDGIPKIVTNLNVEIPVLVFPGGDTGEVPIDTGMVLAPGMDNILLADGAYQLDFDCAKLDGTEAPTDGTAVYLEVCAMDAHAGFDARIFQGIQALCQKVLDLQAAGGDTNTELEAICKKIVEGNTLTQTMIDKLKEQCELLLLISGSLSTIDGTLVAILSAIKTLCDKAEKDLELQSLILTSLEQITSNTAAITGIETALGQIGCTRDADGNINGSVLVCKVTDTTQTPPVDTIKTWFFGTDGSTIEGYEGEWEACTNLQELADLLSKICEKLDVLIKTVQELLLPYEVDCPPLLPGADFTRGFLWVNGRPPTNVIYKLVNNLSGSPVVAEEGADFGAFISAMEAAGYTHWSNAEQHYFCPCPPGYTEPGSFYIEVDGEVSVKIDCKPLEELPGAPTKAVQEALKALRTMGCYDERRDGLLQSIVDALSTDQEEQALQTAKLCMLENHLNPAAPCPATVPPLGLDKEANTLTVSGDMVANYPAGQSINLLDANGESCGTATVAEAGATLVEGQTIISIEECELDEGKVPAQIVKAAPAAKLVVAAIKVIKKAAIARTAVKSVKEITKG